ncbi:MAG: PQQ-like beta-propeller repeat protein [Solirubrobacteraceae bacterium]|nr:PQQ-like beta-propeller repeat protein [Solirubrobacteraceae bacterium]
MRNPRSSSLVLAAAVTATAVAPVAALAHGKHRDGRPQTPPAPTIALPNAFQPEGIASDGKHLFVGSIPTGAVYRADPRSGQGAVLVPGREGRAAIGLKVAGKHLVVAGGTTGRAFIYDARTGADVAEVPLTTGNAFVNDVVVSKHTAWFTDSRQPQLYRLDLHPGKGKDKDRDKRHKGNHAERAGGRHGDKRPSNPAPAAATLPISGALTYDADPATIDANGIVALPSGKQLLVVQSRTGKLFKVDAATGVSVEVNLGGATLTNGDGMLLEGRTLYVVQNRLNQIAVVKLDRDASAGTVERTITSPLFRVPTTIAKGAFGLYAVNARFGTPPTPTTDYDIVRVSTGR